MPCCRNANAGRARPSRCPGTDRGTRVVALLEKAEVAAAVGLAAIDGEVGLAQQCRASFRRCGGPLLQALLVHVAHLLDEDAVDQVSASRPLTFVLMALVMSSRLYFDIWSNSTLPSV